MVISYTASPDRSSSMFVEHDTASEVVMYLAVLNDCITLAGYADTPEPENIVGTVVADMTPGDFWICASLHEDGMLANVPDVAVLDPVFGFTADRDPCSSVFDDAMPNCACRIARA